MNLRSAAKYSCLFAVLMPTLLSTLRNTVVQKDGSSVPSKRQRAKTGNLDDVVGKKLKLLMSHRDRNMRYRERLRQETTDKLRKQYEAKYLNETQKQRVINDFEERTKSICHDKCESCRCVGINLKMSKKTGLCRFCVNNKLDAKECLKE